MWDVREGEGEGARVNVNGQCNVRSENRIARSQTRALEYIFYYIRSPDMGEYGGICGKSCRSHWPFRRLPSVIHSWRAVLSGIEPATFMYESRHFDNSTTSAFPQDMWEIWRDTARYGIQRNTAGSTAGYSGIQRDHGGYGGIQQDTAGYYKIYSRAWVVGGERLFFLF